VAKSSDLLETKTLRRNKTAKNDARVRNILIIKAMGDSLSALECAKCELFAKSSDMIENK
jgi:hypothetical protein